MHCDILIKNGIMKGYFADIVVFNRIIVNSWVTFTKHFQHSEGIEYILINGKIVLEQGKYDADTFAGKVLRRNN